MAKQYMICERNKDGGTNDWFAVGNREDIEGVFMDILKDTTDPIDDIEIFEITPVPYALKLVFNPKKG